VIRIEHSPQGRVRVIGALEGPILRTLFDTVRGSEVALDLSEVREADAVAVRLIAQLPPDRCKLVGCPRWLHVWIERERRTLPLNGLT
jgi:hypothetical protein